MTFNEIVLKEKDGKTIGKIKCTDKDLFMKDCPVDEKTIKELNAYKKQYIEKSSEIMINKAIDAFNENEKLDKVIIETAYGLSDTYSLIADRKRVYPVIGDPDKTITKSKAVFVTKIKTDTITEALHKKLEEELTKAVCK